MISVSSQTHPGAMGTGFDSHAVSMHSSLVLNLRLTQILYANLWANNVAHILPWRSGHAVVQL